MAASCLLRCPVHQREAEPARKEGGEAGAPSGHSPVPSTRSRKEASTTRRFFWIKGCLVQLDGRRAGWV